MESSPSGQPPKGWYWGMVQTKASPRSRSLVAQVFREQGLPLLYYSDDYSDDLPHWIPMPGGKKDEGLLIVPYVHLHSLLSLVAAVADSFSSHDRLLITCVGRTLSKRAES